MAENGSCYGGNDFYFNPPRRTWHRLRSETIIPSNGAENLGCQGHLCEAQKSYLSPMSLPFSAKVTVVLSARDQPFSGWDKYPVP